MTPLVPAQLFSGKLQKEGNTKFEPLFLKKNLLQHYLVLYELK